MVLAYLRISQNTLSIFVEKMLYFKVDSCPKKISSIALVPIGLISSDVSSHWTYKHSRLERSNNQGDNKQKSSAVNRLP